MREKRLLQERRSSIAGSLGDKQETREQAVTAELARKAYADGIY
jgi:hypothetical protein